MPHETDGIPNGALPVIQATICGSVVRRFRVVDRYYLWIQLSDWHWTRSSPMAVRNEYFITNRVIADACAIAAQSARGE